MTYTCPTCGRVYLTEIEMKRCNCRTSRTCPECRGTGKKVTLCGPTIDCPKCNGSGRLF